MQKFSELHENKPHEDIAAALNSLGCFYIDVGEEEKGVIFILKALFMRSEIYKDTESYLFKESLKSISGVYGIFRFSPGIKFINIKNKDGKTLLFKAIEREHLSISRFLLGKGADINAVDKDTQTPLHMAAENDKVDMVKFLLREGANIDAEDPEGKTPLYLAVENDNTEVAKLLLKKGAGINPAYVDEAISEEMKAILREYLPSADAEMTGTMAEQTTSEPTQLE